MQMRSVESVDVALGGGAFVGLTLCSLDVDCHCKCPFRFLVSVGFGITSVRLKREQIQLVALDAAVGFVFDSGNHLTERRFFEERH
jgi:hypothetical protein